ncbi:sugar ABC transporter permease [Spirochaetia bacterium]|nr:sugar ABC transporter permease [Spirochaetia bacterium]
MGSANSSSAKVFPPVRHKLRKNRWDKDDSQLALLTLPTTVWYILFCYLPMFGALIAFKDFRIRGGGFIASFINSAWVGLDNFKFLFMSNDMALIIRNTLAYNIVFLILGVVLPVTLAIIISELRNKFLAKVYQTMMFFPYFLSWVVVSAIVLGFLSTDKGMFNSLRESFGLPPYFFYMEKKFWPPFLIFMSQWKGLGFGMVVYLAAITGLDKTYFEAAIIDGATKTQQIRYITLPLIKKIIILMFILSVGGLFRSDFGLFYLLPRNSGALFDVTYTIDVYIYRLLTGTATTGMASAAALLQSVICCIMILSANWIVRKVDNESAMI